LLPRAARADHHMGIDEVRYSACGEQPRHARCRRAHRRFASTPRRAMPPAVRL
jgi:hypothetical protein